MSLVIVCKNDGRQVECNEKWPLGLETKMLGYPKECHNLCAYEGIAKSRDVPRSVPSCWQIKDNKKDGISQRMSLFVCLWNAAKK